MGIFSFLGFGNSLKAQLRKGGTIVDVRTVHEYDQGRIRGSINIPLDRISSSIERIRNMEKPLLICSASDSRSASAARILKKNGITEVYDGGNWEKLLRIKQAL